MSATENKRISIAGLKAAVKKDPAVFMFLGATVAALTVGMGAMLRNDKRRSQSMMRARVFFQMCTVGALMGGVYYRAYLGDQFNGMNQTSVDNRLYLKDPRAFEVAELVATKDGAVVAPLAAPGGEAGAAGGAGTGAEQQQQQMR